MILIDSSMILAFNNFVVSCRIFSLGEESFVIVLAQAIIICELSFWVTREEMSFQVLPWVTASGQCWDCLVHLKIILNNFVCWLMVVRSHTLAIMLYCLYGVSSLIDDAFRSCIKCTVKLKGFYKQILHELYDLLCFII